MVAQGTESTNYAVLVNTCDRFEDCWDPFFLLMDRFWPDCRGRVYLNSEDKEYHGPRPGVVSVRGHARSGVGRRLTWSECCLAALDTIAEEIVLYLQEDYFFNGPVLNGRIEEYVARMERDPTIHCIQLTAYGPRRCRTSARHPDLGEISLTDKDRVCCQAGLWRKDVLRSYLRRHETAWNFEWFGSKRATYLGHNFYTVHPDDSIIPYLCTGVMGGRWHQDVPALFRSHGIEMPYEKRGFFVRRPKTLRERLRAKLLRLPVEIRSGGEVAWLRWRHSGGR